MNYKYIIRENKLLKVLANRLPVCEKKCQIENALYYMSDKESNDFALLVLRYVMK